MNKHELGSMLRNAPENMVKVDDRLHQDIMRSVRLAGPAESTSRFTWAGPALGAAMVIVVVAVLHTSNISVLKTEEPLVVRKNSSLVTFEAVGDSLKKLTDSSLMTENELELELERLKSDLKRFDFRS